MPSTPQTQAARAEVRDLKSRDDVIAGRVKMRNYTLPITRTVYRQGNGLTIAVPRMILEHADMLSTRVVLIRAYSLHCTVSDRACFLSPVSWLWKEQDLAGVFLVDIPYGVIKVRMDKNGCQIGIPAPLARWMDLHAHDRVLLSPRGETCVILLRKVE